MMRIGTAGVVRAVVVAGALAGSLAVRAVPVDDVIRVPTDGRLQGLAALYADDAVSNVRGYCVQRLRDTGPAWDAALANWHGINRASLEELERLQGQIVVALRTHPTTSTDLDNWSAIVTARLESMAFVLQQLAPLDDAGAKRYCDDALASYPHRAISAQDMDSARQAAAAALEILNHGH